MPAPSGKEGCANRAPIDLSLPDGEPQSPIVDTGPLHMHHRPRAASSRRQARLWVARKASARDGAGAALTRRGPRRARSVGRERPLQAAEMTKASAGVVEAGARVRGKGIARPEQPREPKQSWRPRAQHARMRAITTGRRVCAIANPEQAPSRSCVGTGPHQRSARSRSPGCCSARAERSSHRCRDKRCSVSSTPEATVGPSLVPAFLAEQQRGR